MRAVRITYGDDSECTKKNDRYDEKLIFQVLEQELASIFKSKTIEDLKALDLDNMGDLLQNKLQERLSEMAAMK